MLFDALYRSCCKMSKEMTLNGAQPPAPDKEELKRSEPRYPDVSGGEYVEGKIAELTKIGHPTFIQGLVVSNRELQEINIELNKQNERRKVEIERLEKELEALRTVSATHADDIKEKDKHILELHEEISQLKGDNESGETKEDLQDQVQALKEEVIRLKQENERMNEDSVKTKSNDFEEKLVEALELLGCESLDEMKTVLKEKEEIVQRITEEKNKEIEAARSELAKKVIEIQSQEQKFSDLEGEVARMTQIVEEKERLLQAAEKERNTTQETFLEYKGRIEKMELENQELREKCEFANQVEEYTQKIQIFKKENESLKEQLQSKTNEHEQAKKQLQETVESLEIFKEHHEEMETKVQELKSELESEKKVNEEMKAELSTVESVKEENELLRQEITSQKAKWDSSSVAEALQEKTNRIEELEARIVQVLQEKENELEIVRKENAQKDTQIQELVAQLPGGANIDYVANSEGKNTLSSGTKQTTKAIIGKAEKAKSPQFEGKEQADADFTPEGHECVSWNPTCLEYGRELHSLADLLSSDAGSVSDKLNAIDAAITKLTKAREHVQSHPGFVAEIGRRGGDVNVLSQNATRQEFDEQSGISESVSFGPGYNANQASNSEMQQMSSLKCAQEILEAGQGRLLPDLPKRKYTFDVNGSPDEIRQEFERIIRETEEDKAELQNAFETQLRILERKIARLTSSQNGNQPTDFVSSSKGVSSAQSSPELRAFPHHSAFSDVAPKSEDPNRVLALIAEKKELETQNNELVIELSRLQGVSAETIIEQIKSRVRESTENSAASTEKALHSSDIGKEASLAQPLNAQDVQELRVTLAKIEIENKELKNETESLRSEKVNAMIELREAQDALANANLVQMELQKYADEQAETATRLSGEYSSKCESLQRRIQKLSRENEILKDGLSHDEIQQKFEAFNFVPSDDDTESGALDQMEIASSSHSKTGKCITIDGEVYSADDLASLESAVLRLGNEKRRVEEELTQLHEERRETLLKMKLQGEQVETIRSYVQEKYGDDSELMIEFHKLRSSGYSDSQMIGFEIGDSARSSELVRNASTEHQNQGDDSEILPAPDEAAEILLLKEKLRVVRKTSRKARLLAAEAVDVSGKLEKRVVQLKEKNRQARARIRQLEQEFHDLNAGKSFLEQRHQAALHLIGELWSDNQNLTNQLTEHTFSETH